MPSPDTLDRITASELEWGLLLKSAGDEDAVFSFCGDDGVLRSAIANRPAELQAIGRFLSNAAKLYVDLNHIEYATPESRSFMGTVSCEIAGERIVYECLNQLVRNQEIGGFILNKRVVDDLLHTWGYHINLSADGRKMSISQKDLAPTGLHLATQNLYLGAGAVYDSMDGTAHFVLGQKVLNLNCDYSSSTHSSQQPLVSTREQSHARMGILRIHQTSVDANMSPWQTWIRFATTSLLLRLIENGYRADELMLPKDRMHVVAKQVAHDLTMKKPVELANGKTIRPIEIQFALFEKAKAYAESREVTEEEAKGLVEWERALSDLEVDYTRLKDRVDWVAKKLALEHYATKHGLKLNDPEVKMKDRQFDNMGPLGIGQKLRQGLWKKWMPEEATIEKAKTEPLEKTRAQARGKFVKHFAERVRCAAEGTLITSIDWEFLNFNTNQISTSDPFLTYDVELKALIEAEELKQAV